MPAGRRFIGLAGTDVGEKTLGAGSVLYPVGNFAAKIGVDLAEGTEKSRDVGAEGAVPNLNVHSTHFFRLDSFARSSSTSTMV